MLGAAGWAAGWPAGGREGRPPAAPTAPGGFPDRSAAALRESTARELLYRAMLWSCTSEMPSSAVDVRASCRWRERQARRQGRLPIWPGPLAVCGALVPRTGDGRAGGVWEPGGGGPSRVLDAGLSNCCAACGPAGNRARAVALGADLCYERLQAWARLDFFCN